VLIVVLSSLCVLTCTSGILSVHLNPPTRQGCTLRITYIVRYNRTAGITSGMDDSNDIIFHMVNMIFYTNNSMEDVMNFIIKHAV